MTKKELKALPQSAFAEHTHGLQMCRPFPCAECGVTFKKTGLHYHKAPSHNSGETICPSCYANHPEAPAARRYVVGTNSKGFSLLWCNGACYSADKDGRLIKAQDSLWGTRTEALAANEYDREIQEPEARAWAEKHGHADALFPGEDEAVDVWPKFAVLDRNGWYTVVRHTSEEDGEYARPSGARRKDHDGWSYHTDNTMYHEVTEAQAREYAAEHSIPWQWGEAPAEDGWEYGRLAGILFRWHGYELPEYDTRGVHDRRWAHCLNGGGPEWCMRARGGYRTCTRAEAQQAVESANGTWPGEEGTIASIQVSDRCKTGEEIQHTAVGTLDPDHPLAKGLVAHWDAAEIAAEEQPTSKPAQLSEPLAKPDNPQPVGYFCRECGQFCHVTKSTGYVACRKCQRQTGKVTIAANKSWLLPGPLPGPWQDTDDWTGEYRPPKKGDRFVGSWGSYLGKAQISKNNYNDDAAIRHILRPKAQPAEPGAQCRGCQHLAPSYPCRRPGITKNDPWTFTRANPANDCEHFTAKEVLVDGTVKHPVRSYAEAVSMVAALTKPKETDVEHGDEWDYKIFSPSTLTHFHVYRKKGDVLECYPDGTTRFVQSGNNLSWWDRKDDLTLCTREEAIAEIKRFGGKWEDISDFPDCDVSIDTSVGVADCTYSTAAALNTDRSVKFKVEYDPKTQKATIVKPSTGKEAKMSTVQPTRFTRKVTCPKCGATRNASDFEYGGNLLQLTCSCGGTVWNMLPADTEPTRTHKAAKWLALATPRMVWAVIRRIPNTLGIHPDHPHMGKLWATIQMLVGGTIISSIPGAWEFIGSHTEPLWMAPVELAQATWNSVASIDYGSIIHWAGPATLAIGGIVLACKRGKKA